MPKNDGSGHYYRGDKRIDIGWGDKISDSLKESYRSRERNVACVGCGETFVSGAPHAKWCSWECSHKHKYTDKTGVEKKAIVFGANLLMGRGKKQTLIEMIDEALDTPCRYCKEILTIENVSVDHVDAYGDSKQRYDTSALGKEIRRKMDAKENLQMICRKCNMDKGDFDDDEFMALLAMDDEYPGIVRKLKRRLAQAKLSWGKMRK